MSAMDVDFGRTVEDYARYRAGFPDELFARLSARGIGSQGQRILDLGSGTGSLALGFAAAGARVTALDRSAEMLEELETQARRQGLAVETVRAKAEKSGLPDGAFEVVAAGQCWHWFERDAAAREARRLLIPGGRLLICHFDWIPLPGNLVEATERLIRHHNPNWRFGSGAGLYPAWLRDAAVAGFTDIETFSFDRAVSYSHEAWRGRIRASAGVCGSLPAEAALDFDRELAALLDAEFPEEPQEVPHRAFALLAIAAPTG